MSDQETGPAPFKRFPLAHTFSIVARDPDSGEMGVAVQSHWFSVGSIVTWAEAGAGVVATQAFAEPSYGPLGLTLMRAGKSAPAALAALLSADANQEIRQVAMLDTTGRVAVHTGKRCIVHAGHEMGEGFSVQANMMADPGVWPAMAGAYRDANGNLAERMLAALEAGQAAGGDVRGQQSAAILVVRPVSSGRVWEDRLLDLRVEDHPHPIAELRRLVNIQHAYQWMNQGDDFLGNGQIEQALNAYRRATSLAPDLDELPFWQAVTLAEINHLDEALPIFRQVFRSDQRWIELVRRLPAAGLLRPDEELLRRIIAAGAGD
ncbi:MAG: DUF1028 domain-containing protein [Chloroflexi bacterium]|nr:DUF1028 domain-containing protein [Anaerolineaceae bacterium]NMB87501.1 DUF1028 domain-containing protein [Chloroflexota bacterium]